MSPAAYRARSWREQRRALGRCHGSGCQNSANGYLCRVCALEHAHVMSEAMRVLREARDYLRICDLLSRNRCVECGEVKQDYHAWRHKQCAVNVCEQLGKSA